MMKQLINHIKSSDLRIAFVMGMVGYTLGNLSQRPSEEVAWYIWLTANGLSAITHIILAFLAVKAVKKLRSLI